MTLYRVPYPHHATGLQEPECLGGQAAFTSTRLVRHTYGRGREDAPSAPSPSRGPTTTQSLKSRTTRYARPAALMTFVNDGSRRGAAPLRSPQPHTSLSPRRPSRAGALPVRPQHANTCMISSHDSNAATPSAEAQAHSRGHCEHADLMTHEIRSLQSALSLRPDGSVPPLQRATSAGTQRPGARILSASSMLIHAR
jgi:hypothetical protein